MLQLKTQHKQPQIHCPFCASCHKFGCYTKLSQANKSSFDLSTCESLVVLLKKRTVPLSPWKGARKCGSIVVVLPHIHLIYYARTRGENITRPAFCLPHAHFLPFAHAFLPSLTLNANLHAHQKSIYADKRQRGKTALAAFLPPLTHL